MQLQSLSKALGRLERLRQMIEEARGRPAASRTAMLRLQSLRLRQQERLFALFGAGSSPMVPAPVPVTARAAARRSLSRNGN